MIPAPFARQHQESRHLRRESGRQCFPVMTDNGSSIPFKFSRREVILANLAIAPAVLGRPFSVLADDRVVLGSGPKPLSVPKMGVGES
jgi:hypothetical protein